MLQESAPLKRVDQNAGRHKSRLQKTSYAKHSFSNGGDDDDAHEALTSSSDEELGDAAAEHQQVRIVAQHRLKLKCSTASS